MKERFAGLTVITSDVGVNVTVMVKFAAVLFWAASVAVRVKLETPGAVGVPLMDGETLLFPVRLRPAGSVPPDTENMGYRKNGEKSPPMNVSAWLYGVPAMPLGKDGLVIANVEDEAAIVMEKVWDAVLPLLSSTVAANDVVPTAVGAPLIKPVKAFRLSPGGSDPVVINQP